MKEIGSEFYDGCFTLGENNYSTLIDAEKKYVLSGRTALAYIADELEAIGVEKSVCLPRYCCYSMIEPFERKGFTVEFYDVDEVYQIKSKTVLVMDYFGFQNNDTYTFAQECKNLDKKIVVDATQTAFSKIKLYDLADYLVVSYRKWSDSLCAAVYSRNGFKTRFSSRNPKKYVDIWRKAAKKKRKYLCENKGSKSEFIKLYHYANNLLLNDYEGFTASDEEIKTMENIDSTALRTKRKENAQYILDNMEMQPNCRLMFKLMSEEDCPLFVPILLDNETRNKVRVNLIENSVYCPIHWPVGEKYFNVLSSIHENELSLICDQRYGIQDMKRQIEIFLTN